MTYATILVNLQAGRSNRHVLDAASQLAETFQARVIGTTACTPLQTFLGDGDAYAYGEMFQQDSKEMAREIGQAEAEFREAMGARAAALAWRSAVVMTSLAEHLAIAARAADLVLTDAAADASPNVARRVSAGDLIMRVGRPVLLVAPAPLRMERVLVAWKDTREARRATADAMPVLKQARRVSLVEITGTADLAAARSRLDDVAGWLRSHGVAADMRAEPASGADSDCLETVARELEADIVVAGAYGHSRFTEWALGGVTSDLLQDARRSMLVSH